MAASWLPQMPWDVKEAPKAQDDVNPFQAALDQAQASLSGLFTPFSGQNTDGVEGEKIAPEPSTQNTHPASFANVKFQGQQLPRGGSFEHGKNEKKWVQTPKMSNSWNGPPSPEEREHHQQQSFAVKQAHGTKESYRSFLQRQRGNATTEASFRSTGSTDSFRSGSSGESPHRTGSSARDIRSRDLPWDARVSSANLRLPSGAGRTSSANSDESAEDLSNRLDRMQKKCDKLHEKWVRYQNESEDVKQQVQSRSHPLFNRSYHDTQDLQAAINKYLIEAEDREKMAERDFQVAFRAIKEVRDANRMHSSSAMDHGYKEVHRKH